MNRLYTRLWLFVFFSTGLILACSSSHQDGNDLKLGTFGAFYSKINSGEEFETYSRTGEYADIVVDLGGGGAKFVFWRGSSFLPYLETGKGRWFVEELIPRKGDGTQKRPDRINAYTPEKILKPIWRIWQITPVILNGSRCAIPCRSHWMATLDGQRWNRYILINKLINKYIIRR